MKRVACFSVLHSISFWIMDVNYFTNHTSFLPSILPACAPPCPRSCLPVFPPAVTPALLPSFPPSLSPCMPTYLPSFLLCLTVCFPSLFASLLPVKGRRHYTRSIAKPGGQKMLAAKDQSSMDYLPGLEVLGGIVLRVIESRKPVKALFSRWKLKTYRLLCWQEFSVLAPS